MKAKTGEIIFISKRKPTNKQIEKFKWNLVDALKANPQLIQIQTSGVYTLAVYPGIEALYGIGGHVSGISAPIAPPMPRGPIGEFVIQNFELEIAQIELYQNVKPMTLFEIIMK